MARFTVTYRPMVTDDLTELWIQGPNRQWISDAADEIDRLLGDDPFAIGEEVHEGLRALHVAPLAIMYVVGEDDQSVVVCSVRRIDQ